MRPLWCALLSLTLSIVDCRVHDSCSNLLGMKYCFRFLPHYNYTSANYQHELEDTVANVTLGLKRTGDGYHTYDDIVETRELYLYHEQHGRLSLLNVRDYLEDRKRKRTISVDCLGLIINHRTDSYRMSRTVTGTIEAKSKFSSSGNEEFVHIGSFEDIKIRDIRKDEDNNNTIYYNDSITFGNIYDQARRRFKIPVSRESRSYHNFIFSSDAFSINRTTLGFQAEPPVRQGMGVRFQDVTSHLQPVFSSVTTRPWNMDVRKLYQYTVAKSASHTVVLQAMWRHTFYNGYNATWTSINNQGEVVTVSLELSRTLQKLTISMPTDAWSVTLAVSFVDSIRLRVYENDHFINQRWDEGKTLLDMEVETIASRRQDSSESQESSESEEHRGQGARLKFISKNLGRIYELLGAVISNIKQFVGAGGNRDIAGLFAAVTHLDVTTLIDSYLILFCSTLTTGIDQRVQDVIMLWFQERNDYFKQMITTADEFLLPDAIAAYVSRIERHFVVRSPEHPRQTGRPNSAQVGS